MKSFSDPFTLTSISPSASKFQRWPSLHSQTTFMYILIYVELEIKFHFHQSM